VARTRTLRHFQLVVASALAVGLGAVSGCATTEFYNEGPGQPSDRATGAVPAGAIGVCKKPKTRRPPIVSQQLWDDARVCTGRTPAGHIRLGYGKEGADDKVADQQMEKMLEALRDGTKDEGGNAKVVAMLKQVRDAASKDPELKSRVSRESSRGEACDFTYLLNTMVKERGKLEPGQTCAAEAYDPKAKGETCLFDTGRAEGVWLTSSWDCVTHSGALGQEQSCHRLCAYDDYCARQVSCAASDVDLLLCAMGVCLPEQRAGFY
jgi:hypothetical protein